MKRLFHYVKAYHIFFSIAIGAMFIGIGLDVYLTADPNGNC